MERSRPQAEVRAALIVDLLKLAGHPLPAGAEVLDLGCGEGDLVRALSGTGVHASGCDFSSELGDDPRCLPIEEPYRIPFADARFDCVVSNQVLEHVQDYGLVFREIRRVLRPGGASLHIFPPRYALREPHIFVPLATLIQTRWWLWPWALAGVRNQFQHGMSAQDVVAQNREFLINQTAYHRRSAVLCEARRIFHSARFLDLESLAARRGAKARRLYQLARRIPAIATVWSEMRSRSLLLS